MTTTESTPDVHPAWVSSRRVAEALSTMARSEGLSVTWLNHWSALGADWNALSAIDFIGIDGTLLQMFLGDQRVERSSADMVIPQFLELRPDSRVALIGSVPGIAEKAASRLDTAVFATDGYDGLASLTEDISPLERAEPDVIVLGLGRALQDQMAVRLRERFPHAVIFTAGGWIDQLAADEQYFPPIVHQLRLGWLWRIAHEPRRLLRRYTIDAVRAAGSRRDLLRRLNYVTRRRSTLGFQGIETVAHRIPSEEPA